MNILSICGIREKLALAFFGDIDEDNYFKERICDFDMLLRLTVSCSAHYNYCNDTQEQAAYYISLFPGYMIKEVSSVLVTYITSYSVEGDDISYKALLYLVNAIRKSDDYDEIRK